MPKLHSPTQEAPIVLPDWLPPAVAVQVRWIEEDYHPTPEQRAMLARLTTDDRMHKVWAELMRRDRKSGKYFYPVQAARGKLTEDKAQEKALGQVFHFAYHAGRDVVQSTVSVSKWEKIATTKGQLLKRAAVLAETVEWLSEVAPSLGIPPTHSDVIAVCRVANWFSEVAHNLRPESDPLTIRHERGDPIIRTAQILICAQLREMFGCSLHGTAATLASVALNAKTSARVTRSAFSDKKSR